MGKKEIAKNRQMVLQSEGHLRSELFNVQRVVEMSLLFKSSSMFLSYLPCISERNGNFELWLSVDSFDVHLNSFIFIQLCFRMECTGLESLLASRNDKSNLPTRVSAAYSMLPD